MIPLSRSDLGESWEPPLLAAGGRSHRTLSHVVASSPDRGFPEFYVAANPEWSR
jgi:hypothetical protein